ncbi:MAG: hypothetical protein AAF431_03135 [Pseudomonadota bacterium]
MKTDEPGKKHPSGHHSELEYSVKSVLLIQCVATLFCLLLVAGLALLSGDGLAALPAKIKAVVYGAVLAIVGTLLSARSVRRSTELKPEQQAVGQNPVSLVPIFSGMLNKLVIVGGGLAFGLIVLGFSPIYVVASYLVVQISGASQLLLFNQQQ